MDTQQLARDAQWQKHMEQQQLRLIRLVVSATVICCWLAVLW